MVRVDLSYSCRKTNFRFLAGTAPRIVPLEEKIMCAKFEIDWKTGNRAKSHLKMSYFVTRFSPL